MLTQAMTHFRSSAAGVAALGWAGLGWAALGWAGLSGDRTASWVLYSCSRQLSFTLFSLSLYFANFISFHLYNFPGDQR